jgi:IS30 family transposase
MEHLERERVPRRSPRELTDADVTDAARRYSSGATLGELAGELGVAPSTLTREPRRAGRPVRRRRRRAEPDAVRVDNRTGSSRPP